jgi:hypothetical protein
MKLKYEITLADWKAALRLNAKQKTGRYIQMFIRDYVIPSLAIIGVAWIGVAQITGDTQTVDTLLAPVIALVLLPIFTQTMLHHVIAKSFKGAFPPSSDGPGHSLDLNEERILSTRTGIGEATYFWTGICAVARNEKIILLYLSEILFIGIPIRVLSPEQRTEIDRLITTHVTQRNPC